MIVLKNVNVAQAFRIEFLTFFAHERWNVLFHFQWKDTVDAILPKVLGQLRLHAHEL